MFRTIFGSLILAAILLTSCYQDILEKIDDIEGLEWNPTLALPLTHGSFTIEDFADEFSGENFSVDAEEDGLVLFKYAQDEVFSLTAEEMVNINDENYNTTMTLDPAAVTDFPVSGTANKGEIHQLNISTPEGDQMHSALLKGGQLIINISADFPASGSLTLTFNTLTLDDDPLETEFSWAYTGGGTQQFERSLDLNGVDVDFTNGGTITNQIEFLMDLTLNYEGQPVTGTMGVDLNLGIRSLEFSQATGIIAQRSLASQQDAFELGFVDELDGGLYYFNQPRVTFQFSNSFGVPLDVTVNHMIGHSDTRGDLSLTGDIIDTPVEILYPGIDQMGQSAEFTIDIDYQNSNVPALFAWQPNTIDYQYAATINPSGNGDLHFVLDTSRISADVSLELPLYGRFRGLTLLEEYEFDGEIFEEVDNALFRLTSENGFPVNADIQVYFRDELGSLIDSLIYDDKKILVAGITDSNGKVTTPTTKKIDVSLNATRLADLAEVASLLLRATLNTPDNDTQSVKIYEEDQLELKLFVQTEFEISL